MTTKTKENNINLQQNVTENVMNTNDEKSTFTVASGFLCRTSD